MPSDVFRPRLPLDPFAALDHPPPWRITSSDPPEPLLAHTVLILGTPSHTDLIPLATSSHLVHSLLLIATHTPPPVPVPSPHTAGPAIIILHLPAPLDIHDSGAVRLVGVLDRAQRVAHAWRTATLPQRRIQQFAELYPGGEFSISEDPELAAIISNTAAPGVLHRNGKTSSSSPLASDTDDTVSLSSTSSVFSSTSSSFRRKSKNGTNPKQTQPQFSALINFLPPGVPDKALLKHAILVTTLATPFLAAPPPLTSTFSPYQQKSQSKRQSIFASLSLSSLGSSQKNQSQRRSRSRTRLPSLFTSAPPPPSSSFTSSSPPSVFAASTETLALVKHQPSHPHLVHVLPYSASYPPPHPHPHRSTTAPSPSTYLSPNNNVHATSRSSGVGIGIGKGKAPIHAYGKCNVKSKLVQSIEQFLLSFAYPPSGAASASSPALSTSSSSSLSGSISISSSGLAPPLPPPPPAKSPLRGSPLGRGGVVNGNAGGSIREEKRRSVNGYRNGYHAASHSMSIPVPPLPLPLPKAAMTMTTKWEQGQQGQAVPYLLPAGVLGARPAASSSPSSSVSGSGPRSVSSGSAFLHPSSALNGHGHGTGTGTGTGDGDGMRIGELILLGLLDGVASGDSGAQGGVGEEGWPRAWIGAGGQVEVVEVGESKVLSSSAGVGVVQPKRAVTREEERHAQNRTKSRVKSGTARVGAGMGGIGASVTPNMPYTDTTTTTTTTGNAKGKGRSPPHTPTHGQGSVPISVRRNEAGLPTPPESSSSLEGESDEDPDQDRDRQGEDADEEDEGEGDGSSLGSHSHSQSRTHVYATPTPPEVYEPDQEREESEKEMERLAGAGKTRPGKTGEGKTETKRKLLRTRVSRFFGRRGEEGEGVVGVVTLEYEEVGVKRGTGAMGRLKRVWAA